MRRIMIEDVVTGNPRGPYFVIAEHGDSLWCTNIEGSFCWTFDKSQVMPWRPEVGSLVREKTSKEVYSVRGVYDEWLWCFRPPHIPVSLLVSDVEQVVRRRNHDRGQSHES